MASDYLTDQGLSVPGARDFLDEIRASYESRMDEEIDWNRNDFFAAVTVEQAVQLGELAEGLQAIHEARVPSQARGIHLDNILSYSGLTRRPATPSTIDALRLEGEVTAQVTTDLVVQGGGPQGDARWTIDDDRRLGVAAQVEVADVGTWQAELAVGNDIYVHTYSAGTNDGAAEILEGMRREINTNGQISGAFEASTVDTDGDGQTDRMVVTSLKNQDFTLSFGYGGSGQGSGSTTRGRHWVTATAQQPGETFAGAGVVDTIVNAQSGLSAVASEQAATLGQPRESDAEALMRREESLQAPGSTAANAVLAALLDRDFLDAAVVLENDQDTQQTISGITLPNTSLAVIVWPDTLSDDQEESVALSIYRNVAGGIEVAKDTNFQTVSKSVERRDGQSKVVPFHYAAEDPTDVTIQVSVRAPLSVEDVEDDIVRSVRRYIDRLDVGEDVRQLRLYGLIDEVRAVETVSTLTIDGASTDKTISATDVATLDTVDVS